MNNKWIKGLRLALSLCIALSLMMSSAFATAYDVESLKEEVSQHMINWETEFEILYVGNTDPDAMEKLKSGIREAISCIPYVAENVDQIEVGMIYNAKQAKISIKLSYLTDPERENALNLRLEEALTNMGLKGLSDYQKVKRIADWISDHHSYDDNITIYSASEMSEKGVGVCQAYASMFYKMVKAAGLDVTYQYGSLNGDLHLWNLVNIGGKWYHVDVTNYDANNRSMLMMVGTSDLDPLVYQFAPEAIKAEPYSNTIDKSYDNGLFDASLIKERLMPTAYKSEGWTEDYGINKKRETLYKQLDDACAIMLNKPTKESYNGLMQLISKGRVLNLDTSLYETMAQNISTAQYEVAKALISQASTQIKALKGSQYTEKSALAVLSYVEALRIKVEKANILDSHRTYLNAQVSVLGKEAANYLLQSYYNSYKRTKSSTWLAKIKAINGKYGITMTIK